MRHALYLALRDLRALWRQPWFVAVTLVQPLIWLLLFGELFKSMADLPGFGDESYIAYLAPGIVVMSALFSSGWSGMATIEDINRGVTDRLLVSPVRRWALIGGRVAQAGGGDRGPVGDHGAHRPGRGRELRRAACSAWSCSSCSPPCSAPALAALSNALALVTRQEESLIGAVTFLVLPLTFLSTALVSESTSCPAGCRRSPSVNPVDWAIEAGRSATAASPDWGLIATDVGLLAVLLAACGALATRAFRSYQASV